MTHDAGPRAGGERLDGMQIEGSLLVPKGMIVWRRGREVLGLISEDRQDFFRQFGFVAEAPPGCDGITLSAADFEIMKQDLAELDAGRLALSNSERTEG